MEKPVSYPGGGELWGVMVCARVKDVEMMVMEAARIVVRIILAL